MIAGALTTYLADTEEERVPDHLFHPSSMFQCDRLAIYEQRAYTKTDEKKPEERIPLRMGTLIHELLQASVTHMADTERIVEAWHEVKVVIPTLDVTGSADSLLLLADGTYELEEFKSTKSAGIKYAKGGFTPKENHVNQGLTYVFGLRYFPWYTEYQTLDGTTERIKHPPLGAKLEKLRVTYFGKDAGEILEFTYSITPEWESWFVKYMTKLKDWEGLPPRKPEKDWLCKSYCAFRTRCWEQDGE